MRLLDELRPVHGGCKSCTRLSVLQRGLRRLIRALTPILALAACATLPAPTEQLAAARVMVAQAQPLATQEGAAELKQAQLKLVQAEDAMQRLDYRTARILAEQAEVDARYAWTAAESARMRQAAAQVGREAQ